MLKTINQSIIKMSYKQLYWVLRQNYGERTNQKQMRDFIMSQKFVTCPWGGWGKERENVINGVYNEKMTADRQGRRLSKGQDRKFVEDMKIGDIILIPFPNKLGCIVARITSNVEYAYDTGLLYNSVDANGSSQMSFSETGDLPFRPVGRRIEILQTEFNPSRHLGQLTLSKMNKVIVDKLNEK